MTQEMSVDILGREGGEQIDPGKLTMQQSDGHVRRDKGRDGQVEVRCRLVARDFKPTHGGGGAKLGPRRPH